jgi:DNA-binding NarL/FixJ family response regulator
LVVRFLVLEDDPLVSGALKRLLREFGEAVPVPSLAEARAALDASSAWDALFVDIVLPDGSGLDALAHARRTGCNCPALVLSATYEPGNINRAFDLGAQYLVKPFDPERITAFVRDATTTQGEEQTGTVRAWMGRYRLTRTEASILEAATDGATRDQLAQERGVARGTVKKHVQNLLRKTGDASLLAACARLLRERVSQD